MPDKLSPHNCHGLSEAEEIVEIYTIGSKGTTAAAARHGLLMETFWGRRESVDLAYTHTNINEVIRANDGPTEPVCAAQNGINPP